MRRRKLSKDAAERYNWLVSYICKVEGLKSQVKRADVREILGHIADLQREFQWSKNKYDLGGLCLEETLSELAEVRESNAKKRVSR